MANTIKAELVATILRESSNEVEIISQGEVDEYSGKFYPAFCEPLRFHPEIPIFYTSVLAKRWINGLWSNWRTLRLFKARHRERPFDLVIIWNLKGPQVACAEYAARELGLPVVLEYEDDVFVSISGMQRRGLLSSLRNRTYGRVFSSISGCLAVSPHLRSQTPAEIPAMVLRGVAGKDVMNASEASYERKRNWVLFSGTHCHSNGVVELVEAWKRLDHRDWELHITGSGELTEILRKTVQGVKGIHFHGFVDRERLVELMVLAKVCINPHAISATPGNVFAFKIIEYIAAGAHVVTTPMGTLEQEIEQGITYMPDNSPETISATLAQVIVQELWMRRARSYVVGTYGAEAVARSLGSFVSAAAKRELSVIQ